jgi:hypothetical protein
VGGLNVLAVVQGVDVETAKLKETAKFGGGRLPTFDHHTIFFYSLPLWPCCISYTGIIETSLHNLIIEVS